MANIFVAQPASGLAQQFSGDFVHEVDPRAGNAGHALIFVGLRSRCVFGHPSLNVCTNTGTLNDEASHGAIMASASKGGLT